MNNTYKRLFSQGIEDGMDVREASQTAIDTLKVLTKMYEYIHKG